VGAVVAVVAVFAVPQALSKRAKTIRRGKRILRI
jgi:hypothetical protein